MPFTDLNERLDANGNHKPGYEPFNQIDETAMFHDWCYSEADKGVGTRHICDSKMLDNLNKIKFKNFRERIDYALVKPVIWLKYKLGLGHNEQLAIELHKPIRHKFKRRRVFVYNVDDIWSADLIDKQNISKYNKGTKYILTVIDLFSKYAYVIPLKSKSSQEIIDAFKKLFVKNKIKKLWTDQGSEFTNNKFKKFLKDNNIELYHVHNEGKACVVERFNRTLGEMIARHLTKTNSKNYVNNLQQLLDGYNHRYHRSIKMSPFEATKVENSPTVYKNLFPKQSNIKNKPKFKVNDKVRIYKYKNTFAKGSADNWTKEIFVITNINNTVPITYKIKDLEGEDILGSFYAEELQLTKF